MKWKTLQHNGILFPPAYEAHGIKIKIKGENVDLDLNQEEMIYQWAKKKDTAYAQDKVFQKNFTEDFAKTLPSKFKNISYQDIDFSHAYKIVDKEKDLREIMTKEENKALAVKRKELREKLVQKYGKAIMDGKEVDVANYMAEPPGIFIGRGDHPLRGRWKPRVTAKDVTLNLGKEAKVPEGNWGKIVHDNDSMWLAGWTDYLTGKRKYVWLADTAGLKQDRDKAKYEKAVKLSKEIEKIKDRIVKDMKSKDPKISRIERDSGQGTLYYSAHIRVYQPAGTAGAQNRGLSIYRNYYPARADTGSQKHSSIEAGQVGELVTVRLTLVLPNDAYYMMVEDFIPAGAEILDTSLKTSRQGTEESEPDVAATHSSVD